MTYAATIPPGTTVDLSRFDPRRNSGLSKEEGQQRFAELAAELDVLQEELYAADVNSLLLVLQGMDTSGKDGTIRSVMAAVDPQGCRVESFKVPTSEELAHDFLWRVHKVVPRRGMIGVFNRSHYEDVLVVRVLNLAPEQIWRARYEQINQFEALLAASGTIIVKCFLHISREEQEARLLAREQDVTKAWKLSAGDWRNREHWDAYTTAYEDALTHCSTAIAPWHVIPADRKWHRNLAVCEAIVTTLREHRPAWHAALESMSERGRAELAAYRAGST
ncbi:MAG TPA: polyphosphate kinase 2 family protein [Roseiflexaceae bacterium]|nr:polyphosphate kinase 2 family protein [Roseiflexaceae bacterium]HMP41774.1 polyphosphate kinase 2 family protein [Roseiflexaceae bacterium]